MDTVKTQPYRSLTFLDALQHLYTSHALRLTHFSIFMTEIFFMAKNYACFVTDVDVCSQAFKEIAIDLERPQPYFT